MLNQINFVRCNTNSTNFKGNNNSNGPLTGPRLSFGTSNFKSIYMDNTMTNQITDCFKANALSFKGEDSGRGGMMIQIPKDSPFDARHIGFLISIIKGNEDLVKDVVTLMKPLEGVKGDDIIRTIAAIIHEPRNKPLVQKMVLMFNKDSMSKFGLSRDIASLVEAYNPDNKIHQEVLKMVTPVKKLNSCRDIVDFLKYANNENICIMQKLVNNVKDTHIVNALTVKLIADEILDVPEKEQVLDKLLNYTQADNSPRTKCDLEGILSILEIYETANPVHEELLDVLLDCNKGLWGLVIGQYLEMSNAKNKDLIIQAVNEAEGIGFDAAKQIMDKIKLS